MRLDDSRSRDIHGTMIGMCEYTKVYTHLNKALTRKVRQEYGKGQRRTWILVHSLAVPCMPKAPRTCSDQARHASAATSDCTTKCSTIGPSF